MGLVGEAASLLFHFDVAKTALLRLLYSFSLLCKSDNQLQFAMRLLLAMRRLSEKSIVVDSLTQLERKYRISGGMPAYIQAWRRLASVYRSSWRSLIMADDEYCRPGVEVTRYNVSAMANEVRRLSLD